MAGSTMMSNQSQPAALELSAAVLAGGASRRMGRDKALMTLDGRTLLDRAVAAVASLAGDTFVVGDRASYHQFGVPVVADLFPGAGPLGGIATALRHARHEHVLVVACDMPFLSLPLLRAMAAQPRDYDVLVPVIGGSPNRLRTASTYETLHAIYERSILPALELRIARGELQVAAALAGLVVRELPEAWLREYDPALRSFVNANRPDDWEAAKALFGDESVSVEERVRRSETTRSSYGRVSRDHGCMSRCFRARSTSRWSTVGAAGGT
jgi:molybdopterin-guanine dinucleotide biosynthesis protein A